MLCHDGAMEQFLLLCGVCPRPYTVRASSYALAHTSPGNVNGFVSDFLLLLIM